MAAGFNPGRGGGARCTTGTLTLGLQVVDLRISACNYKRNSGRRQERRALSLTGPQDSEGLADSQDSGGKIMAKAGRAGSTSQSGKRPPPLAATRKMTVIAQDPAVKAADGKHILMSTVTVPAEVLAAGPRGYRVHVVDYDATTGSYHGLHELPIEYELEPPAWQAGSPAILTDYRFHAQNVYALIMKTLARFELALGRRVGWSFETHQLNVAPHAMLDANAFYSPADQGLVFGYFAGVSGKPVFTSLSHDVVVHETTHALVDALREKYMLPSSPDQAAFHEGYSDVIALLSVFSQPELVEELLCGDDKQARKSRTLAPSAVKSESLRLSALLGLAEEMGAEMGNARGNALRRSVAIEAASDLLDRPELEEPHRRGEVFSAAVLNAFVGAWSDRIVGVGRGDGLGTLANGRYSLQRVAEEGAAIADYLTTMLIRALDYMPPVHVTFGDVLSAMLTADLEIRPDDSRYVLRSRLVERFAAYGIRPASDRKDIPGIWNPPEAELSYGRVHFESMRSDPDEVFRFLWENRCSLGLREEAYTRVLSVRPCVRVGIDGFTLRETVAEYYQVANLTLEELRELKIKVPAALAKLLKSGKDSAAGGAVDGEADDGAETAAVNDDGSTKTIALQGGGTLIFDEYGRLKYLVSNDVLDAKRQSARLADLVRFGSIRAPRTGSSSLTTSSVSVSTMHRLRSLDGTRMPGEGW